MAPQRAGSRGRPAWGAGAGVRPPCGVTGLEETQGGREVRPGRRTGCVSSHQVSVHHKPWLTRRPTGLPAGTPSGSRTARGYSMSAGSSGREPAGAREARVSAPTPISTLLNTGPPWSRGGSPSDTTCEAREVVWSVDKEATPQVEGALSWQSHCEQPPSTTRATRGAATRPHPPQGREQLPRSLQPTP